MRCKCGGVIVARHIDKIIKVDDKRLTSTSWKATCLTCERSYRKGNTKAQALGNAAAQLSKERASDEQKAKKIENEKEEVTIDKLED